MARRPSGWLAAASCLFLAACSAGPAAVAPAVGQPRVPDLSPDDSRAAVVQVFAPGVRDDGIGPVTVGVAVPREALEPLDDLGPRYAIRFVADAQPLEGFWLGEPPVFAALQRGPFREWVKKQIELGLPDADRFREEAVARALDGADVDMAFVETPGRATPHGVEVGTSHVAFAATYPHAAFDRQRPMFDDPTCVARTPELPRVRFFFADCARLEAARVIRIAVW